MSEDLPQRALQPAGRYHSLDALRAAMMLLGLVLHSAASYTLMPLREAWPYQDAHTSPIFDVLVSFIHVFRMPVFFVAAGFFGALLYVRDGAAGFVRNRTKRVLLPLLLFWPVVVPIVGLSFLFALERLGRSSDWQRTIAAQPILQQPILGHLWFLYHLLFLYAGALLLISLAARVPGRLRRRLNDGFRSMSTNVRGLAALTALTTLTLVPMRVPGMETSATLLPSLPVLSAYGVFFAFGWLLFGCRDLLPSFGSRWKWWMAAGLCSTATYFAVVAGRPIADPTLWHVASVGLAAASMWLLTFGTIGLFVRHLGAPAPLVRYLSDASYWMYLVHMAPIVWTVGLLARADAPAFVKFAIVLSVTTVGAIVTYHYFVRSTAIGTLLNGRRYPRTQPPSAPVAAATPRAG